MHAERTGTPCVKNEWEKKRKRSKRFEHQNPGFRIGDVLVRKAKISSITCVCAVCAARERLQPRPSSLDDNSTCNYDNHHTLTPPLSYPSGSSQWSRQATCRATRPDMTRRVWDSKTRDMNGKKKKKKNAPKRRTSTPFTRMNHGTAADVCTRAVPSTYILKSSAAATATATLEKN